MTRAETYFNESPQEKLIKSKKRVRKHGEVFTPAHIVKKMLDLPPIKIACQDITKTFFEPGVGEGAFLVEILNRKLKMVAKEYNDSIAQYENYALLALSTIYGIELLDDNTRFCSMVLYEEFYKAYQKQLEKHNKNPKPSVKNSARLIISKNIVQGNFLTKLDSRGLAVVFSEWQVLNLDKNPVTLMVQRTEYTLEEIEAEVEKPLGAAVNPEEEKGQMSFSFKEEADVEESGLAIRRYLPCKISLVYREEQEEVG